MTSQRCEVEHWEGSTEEERLLEQADAIAELDAMERSTIDNSLHQSDQTRYEELVLQLRMRGIHYREARYWGGGDVDPSPHFKPE